MTLRGRLYGAAHRVAVEAKRRIKASPRLMAMVVSVRTSMVRAQPSR